MKVHLDTNFVLLGLQDPEYLEFDSSEISFGKLLQSLSFKFSHSCQFVRHDGETLDSCWNIKINGCALKLCEEGMETLLKDGDTVAIKLELVGGG